MTNDIHNGSLSPTGSGSPNNGVLNWDAVLKKTGLDEATLRELAVVFLRECPQLLQEIDATLAAGDGVALRRAAHTLKGSAAIFESSRVVVAAQQLEAMAKQKDFVAAQATSPLVAEEAHRLEAALMARMHDPINEDNSHE